VVVTSAVAGGVGPQAWVWRTETFRPIMSPVLEEFLHRVDDAAAKLINMEDYRRRRLLFTTRKIDKSWRSAWERRKTECADIYEVVDSSTSTGRAER